MYFTYPPSPLSNSIILYPLSSTFPIFSPIEIPYNITRATNPAPTSAKPASVTLSSPTPLVLNFGGPDAAVVVAAGLAPTLLVLVLAPVPAAAPATLVALLLELSSVLALVATAVGVRILAVTELISKVVEAVKASTAVVETSLAKELVAESRAELPRVPVGLTPL